MTRGSAAPFHDLLVLCALLLTVAAAAVFVPRFERAACVSAFAVMAARIVVSFPDAYNHLVLEALLAGAAAGTAPRLLEEDRLMLQSARWLIVIVLFWSGAQKLLHGCYFGGEFLALAMAANEHFGGLLASLFAADVERLRSLGPLAIGGGPYRIDAPAFVAISNLAWIAEIGVAVALLVTPVRTIAAAAAIVLVVCIELVARELVFGLMFIGGLLMFVPGGAYRRAFPWLLGLLACLFVAALALPDVWLN